MSTLFDNHSVKWQAIILVLREKKKGKQNSGYKITNNENKTNKNEYEYECEVGILGARIRHDTSSDWEMHKSQDENQQYNQFISNWWALDSDCMTQRYISSELFVKFKL